MILPKLTDNIQDHIISLLADPTDSRLIDLPFSLCSRLLLFYDGACQASFTIDIPSINSYTPTPEHMHAPPTQVHLTVHLSPSGLVMVVEHAPHAYHSPTTLDSFNPVVSEILPNSLQSSHNVHNVHQQPLSASQTHSQQHKLPSTVVWRGLTSSVPCRFRLMALHLIQFKNTFSVVPYLPFTLLSDKERQTIRMFSSPLIYCRWPTALDSIDGPVESAHIKPDEFSHIQGEKNSCYSRKLSVQTVDRTVQFTLEPNLQAFKVIFPAQIDLSGGSSRPPESSSSRKHSYILVTQIHSVYDPPEWCLPALDLLLYNKETPSPDLLSTAEMTQIPSTSHRSYSSVLLPTAVLGSTSLSATTNSQFSPSYKENMDFEHPKPIRLLQTPQAIFRVLADQSIHHREPSLRILVSWKSDGTLFITNEELSFISLFDFDSSCEPQMYQIHDPPPFARHPTSGEIYPLKSIISTCLDLHYNSVKSRRQSYKEPQPIHAECMSKTTRHDMHSGAHSRYENCAVGFSASRNPRVDLPQRSLSTAVRDSISVPHLGVFTSYMDGRVSVVFSDRTLLEMLRVDDVGSGTCRILGSDGDVVTVRIERPIGFANYVRPAVEFSRWTFADTQSRMALQNKRTKILQVVDDAQQRSRAYTHDFQHDPSLPIHTEDSADRGMQHRPTRQQIITSAQNKIRSYLSL
ncbi:hypothetical protein BASA50_006195 [Batrachochytrium salamandrivorans]|uniref:C5orf34-like C-terminal domain-containing protein n=1 Tax=Batrachochytrium salamandrivorans TaxID=1357716 RepID=A0ABQ8FAK7_9FUNG|nr:hypothetical protein BASA50_006195 [Batrachochytrium salamandrivorans]